METVAADLVVVETQYFQLRDVFAHGQVLRSSWTQIVIVQVELNEIAHIAGLGQEEHTFISDVVSGDVQVREVSHRVGGCDELGAELSKLVISNLELGQLWNITEMTKLNCASLRNLVHIQLQILNVIQSVRFDEPLKTLVFDLVYSEVEDLKVWEAAAVGDELCAFAVNIIATKIDLSYMSEIFTAKKINHTFVTQIISGQLQILNVLQKV